MVKLPKISGKALLNISRLPGILLALPVGLFLAIRFFVWPKQSRRRYRTVLIAVFLLAFAGVNLNYPSYWNSFADFINPKLDAVDLPETVRKLDKWYVLKEADDILNIPHFWDIPYSMGLDLRGGIHLIYKADLSGRSEAEYEEAMEGLRDVIERRVNLFGVSEPQIFVQESAGEYRLIAELAGVTDFEQAIGIIGNAPYLEFRELKPAEDQVRVLRSLFSETTTDEELLQICNNPSPELISIVVSTQGEDPCFSPTSLTGEYLEKATVDFDPNTNQPVVNLELDEQGTQIFAQITERNVDKPLAIYLDGALRSNPIVREKIETGRAQVSGFDIPEARSIARDLNAGALPVKIQLISQQRIGASLGEESIRNSLQAGIIGIAAIAVFMIILYKLSGVLAVASLGVYLILFLSLIKLVPVTLTLPGIAGLILSVGMAVDANVLVFERLREEIGLSDSRNKESKKLAGGSAGPGSGEFFLVLNRAYRRAWPSIRDGNISTILTCAILFWFSTSFIKGFALTLGLGVVVSMFSAMIVTKYLARMLGEGRLGNKSRIWIR